MSHERSGLLLFFGDVGVLHGDEVWEPASWATAKHAACSRVSILLTDFKKGGCYFYIKTTTALLCKRIKSCVNVEETHGFQDITLLIADASSDYSQPQMFAFPLSPGDFEGNVWEAAFQSL